MRRQTFLEALGTEGRGARAFLVRIVRAGASGNGNHYPPEVLRAAAPLFENARVYVKGDEEHLRGKGKDVRALIGRMTRPVFMEDEGGQIRAVFQLMEPEGRMAVKLRQAWDNNMIDLMGFSMDVTGTARPASVNGRPLRQALSITRVDSVDLIVEPGAGGAFINFIEAKDDTMQENAIGAPAREPEHAPLTDGAYGAGDWRAALIALLRRAAPAQLEGLTLESLPDGELLALAGRTMESGGRAGGEFMSAMRQARAMEKRMAMREALRASTLPQAAQNRLLLQFEGLDEVSPLQVQAAIKAERDYLARFTESGTVSGLGAEFSRLESGQRWGRKSAERLDAFFNPKHRDHKNCRSFREAYIDITGDSRVTGRASNCNRARMREALDAETWSSALGDAITRQMVRDYAERTNLDGWRQFVDIVPVNDFRVQERTRFGGYGDLPVVAQRGVYAELGTPDDEKATYNVQKRGGLETVSLEAVKNDDVGAIQRIPARLVRAAKRTESRFVFSFIKDNPLIYDGKNLFCSAHGNLGSAALDSGAFAAARLAMMRQKEPGSNEDLSVAPRFLLVPFEGEETAFDLFRRDGNLDESFEQSLRPIIVPVWTFNDPEDWAVVADPSDIPTIEIGYLDGEEEPSLFVQDSPSGGSLFHNDVLTYKIRHVYGGNVLDYRGLYKSMPV